MIWDEMRWYIIIYYMMLYHIIDMVQKEMGTKPWKTVQHFFWAGCTKCNASDWFKRHHPRLKPLLRIANFGYVHMRSSATGHGMAGLSFSSLKFPQNILQTWLFTFGIWVTRIQWETIVSSAFPPSCVYRSSRFIWRSPLSYHWPRLNNSWIKWKR